MLSGEGFQMKNERKDLYYFNVRDDLIRLIPSQAKSILEVGCAGGMTGKVLKEKGFEEIVGIEVNEAVVKKGKSYYDKLIIGDVGKKAFPSKKKILTVFSVEIFWDIWWTRSPGKGLLDLEQM